MFKFTLKIAWASLLRRKVRSLLVVLMIGMSLWGLLLMEGIYDGMTEQMINNAIRSDSGDISIYARGYRENSELKLRIPDKTALYSQLHSMDGITTFVTRLIQDGLVATAHHSQNSILLGIDLEKERRHGQLDSYLTIGNYDFGPKGKGVILGSRLAKKLKVTIGSKVIISAQGQTNEISSLALKVTGILKTNNMTLDSRAVLIDQKKLQEMLQIPSGVHQIAVILHHREEAPLVQESLRNSFPELDIFRWDQLYPALWQGKVYMEVFNLVTSSIIFTVAGLGIFGVMMVSVMERMREFGIMLAIGTSFPRISTIILTESVLLGLMGFILGTFLGIVTLFYFATNGLDLSSFQEGIESFGMDTITYAVIKTSYFYTAGVAVFLATLISIILPLRVLKKTRIVDSIQFH